MKISVIIPTKNEEGNLSNCLQSLVRQTTRDFEVIICDGQSEDRTKEVAKQFQSELPLRFYSLKPDLGYQRRFGAEKARGKYLCFLDADMILERGVLADCLALIEKAPPKRKVGGVIIPERSFGKGFLAKVKAFEKRMYWDDDQIEACRFFLKKAYQEAGGWAEGMASGEDWDLTRRLREAGWQILRTKEFINHNEGRINLSRALKRKFYYAQKSRPFRENNLPGVKDYLLFVFRPAYFRHWKEFVSHPILGISFCFLKGLEITAGFLGIVSKRFIKADYTKTK